MPENVTVIEDLVDTNYVMQLFRRSELTIAYWRKNDGLPYVRIKGNARDTIRFDRKAVLRWAKKNHRRMYPVSADGGGDRKKAA
jgi:hypothetical protein